MKVQSFGWRALACALALWFVAASASAMEVQPVMLTLSEKVSTGMIAITNQTKESARYHVTAASWTEGADGSAVLTPTTDVVFYPSMLTLNPLEARNLRVGIKVKPGALEKTYRIFIQELPRMVSADGASAIAMMTKMAIPLFFEPTDPPKAVLSLTGLTLRGDEVRFTIKNTGNVHVKADSLVLSAKDGNSTLHTEELRAWYVLANGRRDYVYKLPLQACSSMRSIELELKSDRGPVRANLVGRCIVEGASPPPATP